MSGFDYDLIVIGSGSGGVRAARMSSRYGAKVAIIEESRVGGTCVLRGCVPKKLMLYGAHYAHDFEDAAGFGWTVGVPVMDWPALIAAKNKELERLEGIYGRILRENNVTLLSGRGTLKDAHTVDVDGKSYSAETILVATGSWPTLPDIPGIEYAITSNEALELPALPKRIVIVGGGFIACEFASLLNAVGVNVTIVIRADNILRGFDEDVRGHLAEELEKSGITIERECTVRSIEKTDQGLSLRMHGSDTLETDVVMYATGRHPNTQGLGLEAAGVETDAQGAIIVDEYFQSSQPSVRALGDVINRMQLTPVAIGEAMALSSTLYNNTPMPMDYTHVPLAVFSMPPVGCVGMTETEARAVHGDDIDVYVSRFRPMKHTLSKREAYSMMKLVVDAKTDRVLGCHMVGEDAPEIVQGLAIALKCGATKAQFDATVGIHPTAAEEFVTMRDKRPPHQE